MEITAGVWVYSLREFGIVGSDPFPTPELDCIGNETDLFQCTIRPFECGHSNDAGIRCLGKYQLLISSY